MNEHDINDDITLGESVEIVKDIIEGESNYSNVEEETAELMKLAAFLGEQLIKRYGGNWRHFANNDRCHVVIKHIVGHHHVFGLVSGGTKDKNAKIITDHYSYLVEKEQEGYFDKGKWVQRG